MRLRHCMPSICTVSGHTAIKLLVVHQHDVRLWHSMPSICTVSGNLPVQHGGLGDPAHTRIQEEDTQNCGNGMPSSKWFGEGASAHDAMCNAQVRRHCCAERAP